MTLSQHYKYSCRDPFNYNLCSHNSFTNSPNGIRPALYSVRQSQKVMLVLELNFPPLIYLVVCSNTTSRLQVFNEWEQTHKLVILKQCCSVFTNNAQIFAIWVIYGCPPDYTHYIMHYVLEYSTYLFGWTFDDLCIFHILNLK